MAQALHFKEGTAALGERTIESISENSMEIFHIMFYFKKYTLLSSCKHINVHWTVSFKS